MRLSELTAEQMGVLTANVERQVSDPVVNHHRHFVRAHQRDIIFGIFLAGCCAGAVGWALLIAVPTEFWAKLGPLASIPFYVWLIALALLGCFFFVAGGSWFYEHEEHTRAAERRLQIVVFEECGKLGIEMSAQEAAALIDATPFEIPHASESSVANKLFKSRRAKTHAA